jgi:hypothetical protein
MFTGPYTFTPFLYMNIVACCTGLTSYVGLDLLIETEESGSEERGQRWLRL